MAVREADVRSRTVLLDQARNDFTRAENLFAKKVIPRDRFEQAKTAQESARAALEAAQELKRQAEIALANHGTAVAQAQAAVAVEKTARGQSEAARRTHGEQVKGREAQVEIAQLTLGYATIASPADGYVTKKSVEVGNQVQAGQPLMAVVSLRDLSVVANYKETQIHSIRPGLPVRIRVDALPGREFTGRVDSVMAGTGSAFSLFPPRTRAATTSRSCSGFRSRSCSTRTRGRRSSCGWACRSFPTDPRRIDRSSSARLRQTRAIAMGRVCEHPPDAGGARSGGPRRCAATGPRSPHGN